MKSKRKIRIRKLVISLILIIITAIFTLGCKGNEPKIIGYTYDSGNTVWEMAERCCPDNMDIRDVVREIEKTNGIKDSVVYDYILYKVPIYQTDDTINMNDIIDFEATETGLILYTSDGNGYYWER